MELTSLEFQLLANLAEAPGRVFTRRLLREISAAQGKSVAQIVLRWLIQRGVAVVPPCVGAERDGENIDVFDFEIADRDMTRIAAMCPDVSSSLDHCRPPL